MEKKDTQAVVSGYDKRSLFKGRRRKLALAVIAVVVLAAAGGVWYYFTNRAPDEKYNSKKMYESIANTDTNVAFGNSVEKDQKIDYFISEAWILRQADKLDDSRAMLQKAEELADNGPYPLLYNAVGETLEAQDKPNEAKPYYQRAIDTIDQSKLESKNDYKQVFKDNLKRVQ
jgi:tetratricopeptide (TPR) repeat protein